MNRPAAPRRPSRVAAVALLLALHIAAIESFIHLRATRERGDARLLQLLLVAPDRPIQVDKPQPEPRTTRPPRPLLAPLPPVDVQTPTNPEAITVPAVAGTFASGPAAGPASAAGPARLDLAIPKDFYAHPPPLTPAQEAMRDPRSNHLELTRQEKMDIAFGSVECIAWQREPDGSIYRGPGHWRRIQGISTNPFTAHKPGTEDRPQECVK